MFAEISEARPTVQGKRTPGHTGLSLRPQEEWVGNKDAKTPDSLDTPDRDSPLPGGPVNPVNPVKGYSNPNSAQEKES